ncbi:IS3 family transposase [Heliobacterium chlorum]|uniref:IS3 family transposase n=1 Tax=Heliobacterium chlorum TaxID=2698 RepID=A0ABR7T590_HELCL|nr:IS3 family transposase [Heliobacterium chlorum]MBC9785953.1 IS3 family transposase [Heliobacterium chlorum]
MAKTGKRYSAEFKADTIRMITEKGRSVTSVAKDLGVSEQTIYRWMEGEKVKEHPDQARIIELESELKAAQRRILELEDSVTIPKKGHGTLRNATPEVRYRFIRDHRSEHPVKKMCQLFEVSRSNYYAWKNRKPSQRKQTDAQLVEAIKESHQASGGIYGVDKILADVREQQPCSRKRVHRLMRENGIRSIRLRKYKATTNSNHKLPVAENLLNQNFKVDAPNKVWVSDITYIPTEEGWSYVATVKDLFHKGIVGWAIGSTMTRELVIQALKSAIQRHRPTAGLIHHSDRGSQYCSKEYQALLSQHHMKASMSRKGNCYDNACAETFFSTMKNELIHLRRFTTRDEVREAIFEYIEIFYNRRRRHQSLDYMTPEAV